MKNSLLIALQKKCRFNIPGKTGVYNAEQLLELHSDDIDSAWRALDVTVTKSKGLSGRKDDNTDTRLKMSVLSEVYDYLKAQEDDAILRSTNKEMYDKLLNVAADRQLEEATAGLSSDQIIKKAKKLMS